MNKAQNGRSERGQSSSQLQRPQDCNPFKREADERESETAACVIVAKTCEFKAEINEREAEINEPIEEHGGGLENYGSTMRN
eukprot:5492840-Alexandrium_andersonii.AAC.1